MTWPLTIFGRDYQPIPESWLEHPASTVEDAEGKQLLAVTAARRKDASLAIRYGHVSSENVLVIPEQSVVHGTGVVPLGLETNSGWPRAICAKGRTPDDVLREPEREHLRTLWGERLDEVDVSTDGSDNEVMTGV